MGAIRFVVEGHGAATVVEGEPLPMEPGDLITTPSWTWHDHKNTGDTPIIWLDGADGPMLHYFQAGFANPFHEIADRGRVHDDAGPAPLQRIRTTFQNVHVPALVSENQSCGESAEGPPITTARVMRRSRRRELLARMRETGGRSCLPGSPIFAAVVVGAGGNCHPPPALPRRTR